MEDIENYEVTSVIGSGIFGTCYKVKHKTTSKVYVWKAINYDQFTEEKKRILISEVNLLSKLRHPNLICCYDHIIHPKSSTLYIIMEYCSGGDLNKIIKYCSESSQCLNEVFIWRVLYQIALAINVCHCQNTVKLSYRDINIANVFLDCENNVKLGYFGLSEILEQKDFLRNINNDNKSDIWALGCLIYEICTLKPFSGNNKHNLVIPQFYSADLQKVISFMLNTNSGNQPTIDVITRHPTVLSKSSKNIKTIYNKINLSSHCNFLNTFGSTKELESKFNENLQIHLENVRNKQITLKQKEDILNEKERKLIKREKKVVIMERLANEKIVRANLYLKRAKEHKNTTKTKQIVPYNELDTSYSADPGDNSILPTSTKIDEDHIIKPRGFVRSQSERRVHFNTKKIFESNTDDVVLKEYNFFEEAKNANIKNKKKHSFGMGVFKSFNSKISQSSISLGSKSSSSTGNSNNSEVLKHSTRPMSWTEENKKCAFSLLKVMNAETDKENVHSKITHTKL